MPAVLRLANPRLTAASYHAVKAAWDYAISTNGGFQPGCCSEMSCTCDINFLPLGTLLHEAGGGHELAAADELAVYETRDGAYVAVANIDGPWAVYVDLEMPPPAFDAGERVYVSRPISAGPDGPAIVSRVVGDVAFVRFDREFPVPIEDVRRLPDATLHGAAVA